MNYILLSILLTMVAIGFIQFKRSKEQVNEVGHDRPDTERELSKRDVRGLQIMQDWWTKQKDLVYDQQNPAVVGGRALPQLESKGAGNE